MVFVVSLRWNPFSRVDPFLDLRLRHAFDDGFELRVFALPRERSRFESHQCTRSDLLKASVYWHPKVVVVSL